AVRVQVGADPVQRPAHPVLERQRMEAVQQQQAADGLVLDQPRYHLGTGDLEDPLEDVTVEVEERLDRFHGAPLRTLVLEGLELLNQRLDPLGLSFELSSSANLHGSGSTGPCRTSGNG